MECTTDAEITDAGRFVCFIIDIILVCNSANTSDTAVSNCQWQFLSTYSPISVNIFTTTLIIGILITFEPSFYYFTTDKTKHVTHGILSSLGSSSEVYFRVFWRRKPNVPPKPPHISNTIRDLRIHKMTLFTDTT